MISKNTFKTVVDELYRQRCYELNAVLEKGMTEAFKNERISIERRERILKKFAKNVLSTKQVVQYENKNK